mgnify:CR=1 FL=1
MRKLLQPKGYALTERASLFGLKHLPSETPGATGDGPVGLVGDRVADGDVLVIADDDFEGLDASFVPRESFAKGNYYALAGRSPFTHLIYPAPADAWLGVHLTLDLGGQAKFGPDQEWLDVQRPDDIDYTVDLRRAEGFYAEVRRYWPGLPDGALQPSYSGVRPKIHAPGEKAPDFRIDGLQLHGVPGLVNLFGIESPGLTSALAIGEHVITLLEA